MIDLSDERRQLGEAGLGSSRLYGIISSGIQRGAGRDRGDHIRKLCEELEEHSQSSSSGGLFGSVGDLAGGSTAGLAVVKDEDGKVLAGGEEIRMDGDAVVKNCVLRGRRVVFRIVQMKIPVGMSQACSCRRLPMPFGTLRATGHRALMKFLLSWLGVLVGRVQGLSGISVAGFGRRGDGLLVGRIRLSSHFPGEVMSANAKAAEQLH